MEPRPVGLEDKVYRFGDYRLLPGRQLLLRGEHPVRLGSRALELLLLMVEYPGRLLTKAELVQFAWPDTFVHDDNLKVNIAALRRALAQPGAAGDYIATVPGRGYRFVAPVTVGSAASTPPPAAAVPARGDTLPRSPDIIGREQDIARIAGLLEGRGLLTIVGPAGVGKTTAALAAARRSAEHFADGSWFIDLAAIGDPQLVAAAVAAGIGSGGTLKDLVAGIVDALRGQSALLIFDNCEHVLKAASLLAERICAAVPGVAILATSREPLRCRSETVYRLQPLPYPVAGEQPDRAQAMTYAAVRLFATRAGEAAGYQLDDADAPVVADICRRLDGIPLAIELAVPRLRTSDATTLRRLLDRNLGSLGYGPARAPLRQQTLLATLDWSYHLLSEEEAAILRLLSVFAGSFTLEDAVALGAQLDRPPEHMASGIGGLVAKSLLSSSFSDDGLHYRLLDATRSYAAERLRGAGEHRRAFTAHAACLLGVMERAEAEWRWRVREDWTAAYGRLANDLRKALDWAFGEDGDQVLGVRLTASAIPLWDELSSGSESGQRVRTAMQSPALEACGASLRMKLATAHAWSLSYTERFGSEGEAAWTEGLRLAELTGDSDYQLRALWGLAIHQCFQGQHRDVLASLERLAVLAARENDHAAASAGDRARLVTEFYLGDIRGAHDGLARLAQRYDVVTRRPGMSRFQIEYVGIRMALSMVEWVRGCPDAAVATAQAALDGATAIGHPVSQSGALALAVIPVALWTGRIDEAERHLGALVANLNRRGVAIWEPASRFFGGMIRHERGDAAGVEQMRTALADLMAARFVFRIPMHLSMLAEAALHHGRVDMARESIAAALDHLESQEEAWCRPEVLRVVGLLQWQDGDTLGAERTLSRAVRSAGASGARAFELRAATSLAELWIDAGNAAAAAGLLDGVSSRFPPAAIGRDVARARALLDRMRLAPSDARPLAAPDTLPLSRPVRSTAHRTARNSYIRSG